jgi:hypothetical protein
MIQIDANSATMVVEPDGATPATTANTRFVSTHLTTGFISPDTPARKNRIAFHIRGEVDVLADTQQDLADISNGRFVFNFIQVCRVNQLESTWTGRTKNEGEVTFIVSQPPAFPPNQRVSLDSDAASSPFMNNNRPAVTVSGPAGQKTKAHLLARMGDHPNARAPLPPPQNTITHAPNFLRERQFDRDFFSVFVARDDNGVLQPPLAHIHWRLFFDLRVKWLHGEAKPELRSPIFQFDPVAKGGPTDAAVQAVLSNPVPPFTNDIIADAERNGVLSHLNLQFSARRSLLVPNDFFK